MKGKGCGILTAIAIGVALPVCGIAVGALTGGMEPLLWSLASVVLIGLAGIAWSGLRYELTRRNGVLTPAKVVDVSRIYLGETDFDLWNFYAVEYSYFDQDGVKHEGKSRPIRSIPKVTEEHFVRYDPSRPSRSVWIS